MRFTSLLVSLFLIAPRAGASLITSATSVLPPSSTIDFSQFGGFESGGDGYQGTGPIQIGDLVGEDVQWSSSTPEAVVFSGFGRYGLGMENGNGYWDVTRQGFSGLNAPEPNWMTYEFASPVAGVGGFVNYWPGDNPSSVVIEALAADGTVLESHDLLTEAPISTPGQVDAGAFRGIARSSVEIKAFRVWNGWLVLDDLTFTRTPAPPPPSFAFEVTDQGDPAERRVLISRDPNDRGGYPHFQRLLSQDRRVPMNVRAYDTQGKPLAPGTLVYFRVADPPSAAPYEPQQTPYLGDNLDPTGGALSGPTIVPIPNTAPLVSQGTVGTAGLVEMVLTVTDHAAGDNYAVEASLDSGFSCSPNCIRSGIVTAWKRVYIERDRMFRKGSFITEPTITAQRTKPTRTVTEVRVADLGPFADGQRVRLIHAPRRDKTGSLDFYFDDVTVDSKERRSGAGRLWVSPVAVGHVYSNDGSSDPGANPAVQGDAVGVLAATDAETFFETDISLVAKLLDTTFIEFEEATQNFAETPFVETFSDPDDLDIYTKKWFQNANRIPGATPAIAQKANTIHLLGAREWPNTLALDPTGQTCNATVQLGATVRALGTNGSFVFVNRINNIVSQSNLGSCSGGKRAANPWRYLNASTVNAETTDHELAHQWRVNPGSGHCTNTIAVQPSPPPDPPLYCTMNSSQNAKQMGDGVVGFHYQSASDSEYVTIRSAGDPIRD